jgi:hypothetical protein
MAMIQVAKVRAVDGVAREDAGRNRRENMAGVREWCQVRTVHRNKLIAAGGMGYDVIGPVNLIGQLGNAVKLRIALDLDAHQDKISDGKLQSRAASIDAITMCLAAIGNNKHNNLAGKINVL